MDKYKCRSLPVTSKYELKDSVRTKKETTNLRVETEQTTWIQKKNYWQNGGMGDKW